MASSSSSASSFASFVWRGIRKRPRLFNGISGGILCGLSDMVAQEYEHHINTDSIDTARETHHREHHPHTRLDSQKTSRQQQPKQQEQQQQQQPLSLSLSLAARMDWYRAGAAGVLGVFLGGGVYPSAYTWLESMWVGKGFSSVFKKSITEILTVGVFVNSFSMTYRGVLRGDHTTVEVLEHVANEIPTVTRNDLLIWGPYNLLAFTLIPQVIRPATTVCCEACWQAYISLRSHHFEQPEEAEKKNKEEEDECLATTTTTTTTDRQKMSI
mmetsp:Transcript_52018/g.125509  ORF Transcript_52018/g.125509 Transcript_52018/m.125509 type:complete len:270 (-) Transcript_52018:427-1236(-)